MTVGINGWFVGVGRVVVGGVGRLAGRGVLVIDDVVVEKDWKGESSVVSTSSANAWDACILVWLCIVLAMMLDGWYDV